MPILIDKIPAPCRQIQAYSVMTSKLVTLNGVDQIENVKKVLESTNHHSFPVLNTKGAIIGMIPRNFIITLI
jgi:predicted transcriptional regulator